MKGRKITNEEIKESETIKHNYVNLAKAVIRLAVKDAKLNGKSNFSTRYDAQRFLRNMGKKNSYENLFKEVACIGHAEIEKIEKITELKIREEER